MFPELKEEQIRYVVDAVKEKDGTVPAPGSDSEPVPA